MATYDPQNMREMARLLSQVESRDPQATAQMPAIHAARRPARIMGVTGPPGAGKSTLVDQLIAQIRARGERVAVIAIDPSSPFSGGAVLGDRIRMQRHAGDDGVFIRSVGSRGAHGGLALAARAMVEICEAYHFEWVIIETVGVGQSEYDIMALAQTTLVVVVPESGDTVQTLKAGLLEIADVFIVNKADRAGAEAMAQGLTAMVHLGRHRRGALQEDHDADHVMVRQEAAPEQAMQWQIPVVTTTATTGDGVDVLMQQIDRHATYRQHDPGLRVRQAHVRRAELYERCGAVLVEQLKAHVAADPTLRQLVEDVAQGTANPYEAMEQLLAGKMLRCAQHDTRD